MGAKRDSVKSYIEPTYGIMHVGIMHGHHQISTPCINESVTSEHRICKHRMHTLQTGQHWHINMMHTLMLQVARLYILRLHQKTQISIPPYVYTIKPTIICVMSSVHTNMEHHGHNVGIHICRQTSRSGMSNHPDVARRPHIHTKMHSHTHTRAQTHAHVIKLLHTHTRTRTINHLHTHTRT